MYAKIKNSYDRNESMNTKVYHKKELSFFVHTEARFSYRKICPCFCGVTVFCYWYNFSNLGRRASPQFYCWAFSIPPSNPTGAIIIYPHKLSFIHIDLHSETDLSKSPKFDDLNV